MLLATKEPSAMTYEEKQQVVKFIVDKVNDDVKQDLIEHGHISEYPGSSVFGNIVSNINDNSKAWKCEDCAPYLATKIEEELNKYGLNEDAGIRVGLWYENWSGEELGHSVALVHIEKDRGDFSPEINKGFNKYN